jgi:hypothetical protein
VQVRLQTTKWQNSVVTCFLTGVSLDKLKQTGRDLSLVFNSGWGCAYVCHTIGIHQLPVSATRGAPQGLDMFHKFYFVINHKIANNSTTAEAREKISADLEPLKLYIYIYIIY